MTSTAVRTAAADCIAQAKGESADAGVKIVPQSELDMDAFYASASEMIDSKYKSNAVYSEIISDVTATFGY